MDKNIVIIDEEKKTFEFLVLSSERIILILFNRTKTKPLEALEAKYVSKYTF